MDHYYERSWRGYLQALRDCSDWLARYFWPWRAVVRFHRMRDLLLGADTQGHDR